MCAEVHGQRRVSPTNFAEHAVEHLRRSAEATVRLGNIHPHEAERVKRFAHLVRETAVVVVFGGVYVIGGE
jgi:hypothetical protein